MEEPEERFDERAYLAACGAEYRRSRLERGLSREALAELADVHVNTVASVERGEHDMTSTTQCRLLAALGCRSLVLRDNVDIIVLHEGEEAFPRADIQRMPYASIIAIIGGSVRGRRESSGLTLEALASVSGMHANTLWNIERGLVCPKSSNIHRIYRALGISVVTPDPERLILE
ncbi:MAG: helix-turn-helix domain-containing protein [Spirochaetes bacterium]|nr:helix-turn-helix domain-containing protein [Spirochaetota bacterium]MBU1079665.1 helix-turn-helix domain-containing protein [Spirochaetota bacterium]